MALIDYPRVSPIAYTCELTVPGQRTFDSLYETTTDVLVRGLAYWQGSITWGKYSTADEDADIGELEAFFAALSGTENTFDFALPNVQQGNRFAGAVQATAFTATGTSATITLDTTVGGLRNGDLVTIGDHLYRCIAPQVGADVRVTPSRFTVAFPTTVEFAAPYVRARMRTNTPVTLPRDVNFAGPYSLDWREAF